MPLLYRQPYISKSSRSNGKSGGRDFAIPFYCFLARNAALTKVLVPNPLKAAPVELVLQPVWARPKGIRLVLEGSSRMAEANPIRCAAVERALGAGGDLAHHTFVKFHWLKIGLMQSWNELYRKRAGELP